MLISVQSLNLMERVKELQVLNLFEALGLIERVKELQVLVLF